jgi:hypothetical protein
MRKKGRSMILPLRASSKQQDAMKRSAPGRELGENLMTEIRRKVPSIFALAAAIAIFGGDAAWAQGVPRLDARVIAINIPGASAVSQVGTFIPGPPSQFGQCTLPHPIPTLFPSYIQPGAVLDPNRILVGSRSNFGAPLAIGVGQEGSFLSIDPIGPPVLSVLANFAQSGVQASALGGAVQMFSANSPNWLNAVNNFGANTASYTGVSNPLGLSNNLWAALAGKCTIWRHRDRFILDSRSGWAAAKRSPKPRDRRCVRGQPYKPRRRRGPAPKAGDPRLAT